MVIIDSTYIYINFNLPIVKKKSILLDNIKMTRQSIMSEQEINYN